MFGFGKKRGKSPEDTRPSGFINATGGGWEEIPETVAADGGSQAAYVVSQLELAHQYAQDIVPVGERFSYTLTDIPEGISSPHEIVFGMMMQADQYGLSCTEVFNDVFTFTRLY